MFKKIERGSNHIVWTEYFSVLNGPFKFLIAICLSLISFFTELEKQLSRLLSSPPPLAS